VLSLVAFFLVRSVACHTVHPARRDAAEFYKKVYRRAGRQVKRSRLPGAGAFVNEILYVEIVVDVGSNEGGLEAASPPGL
jgi:hypothetical protein